MNDEILSVKKLKEDINSNIGKGIYLKNIIKSHINSGNRDLAKRKIQEYDQAFPVRELYSHKTEYFNNWKFIINPSFSYEIYCFSSY